MTMADDPLIQGEDHDTRDPSQHNMSSSNIEFADFNELTSRKCRSASHDGSGWSRLCLPSGLE